MGGKWRQGEEIVAALELVDTGFRDGDVAELTGIPKATIRTWRRGRVPDRARDALAGDPRCARCGGGAHAFERLPPATYAYALALYLGDGCLHRGRGDVYSLRITLDSTYPQIVSETSFAIGLLRGRTPHVGERRGQRCCV